MSYIEELRRQKQLEHLQKDDPWGKEQADAIAEFGTNVMEGVVGGVTDWWKRSSADQEGWFDDALRLAAGGVKNVAAAAEDQEGYLDDALRLAGGGVKNTLNVIGAGGYYGGKIGGNVIEAFGGDRRLGEWTGGFIGDAVFGAYGAKALKVASTTTHYARLSPFQRALQYGSTSGAMESAAKHTGTGIVKGAREGVKRAFQPELKAASSVGPRIRMAKKDIGELEATISGWIRNKASDLEALGKKPNEVLKEIKDRVTKEWTGQGIDLDGEPFRVKQGNIHEVLKNTDVNIKLESNASKLKRAMASDPTLDPAVQNYFKDAITGYDPVTGRGLAPEFNIDAYGAHIKQMAGWRDKLTSNMASLWGWKSPTNNAITEWVSKSHLLDKEHARSLFGNASNDWLSQFFGSAGRNRSSGKLDDFTSSVMEILGAPTNKTLRSWDANKQKMVINTHRRGQWNANVESAANWAAQQMEYKRNLAGDFTKPHYNPAFTTMRNQDWLRIQSAFNTPPTIKKRGIFGKAISGQEQVAMQVLREAEIRNAWLLADLPTDRASLEVLGEFVEKSWKLDIEHSKVLLEQTIGEYGMKKAFKEMRTSLAPWQGKTIVQPGAKINPKTGLPYSKRELRAQGVKRGKLTILPSEAYQN